MKIQFIESGELDVKFNSEGAPDTVTQVWFKAKEIHKVKQITYNDNNTVNLTTDKYILLNVPPRMYKDYKETFAIQITREKLQELRMLRDWQLKEMGIVPESLIIPCDEAFG